MITICEYIRYKKSNFGLVNLIKIDSVNQMIPLKVILSSSAHCSCFVDIWRLANIIKPVYNSHPWELKKSGRIKEVPGKTEV
jgi:hypothetical protein